MVEYEKQHCGIIIGGGSHSLNSLGEERNEPLEGNVDVVEPHKSINPRLVENQRTRVCTTRQ
jgi:hypothetical protein